jgi:protein SCO1/2
MVRGSLNGRLHGKGDRADARSRAVRNERPEFHMTITGTEGLTRRQLVATFLALGGASVIRTGHAEATTKDQQHTDHGAHTDHSGHMAAARKASCGESEREYLVPDVSLIDTHGRRVPIHRALDDGRPVLLNFVYTSCTTVCPVMTQIFAEVQAKLGPDAQHVHMVSISIDPEFDTPDRLLAYTRQHGVGPQWDFYTGSLEASITVQKAFDAYRGDKMNHLPLTLLRARRGKTWLRLEGFAGPAEIVDKLKAISG